VLDRLLGIFRRRQRELTAEDLKTLRETKNLAEDKTTLRASQYNPGGTSYVDPKSGRE
jgi:hypothetical protein